MLGFMEKNGFISHRYIQGSKTFGIVGVSTYYDLIATKRVVN